MKELKEFTLDLEAERNSFSGGEVLQGSILVAFNQPTEMRNVKVQFYGEAICRWDTVHGSKDRNKNGVKQSKADEVVKLEKVLFGVKEGESPESIPVHPDGDHRYDFEFNLPKYLPCSFESPKERDSGLAYIRYFVTATISRPWRTDITRRKAVNINEIIDTSLPEFAYRPGCQTQKQLGTCFSDGSLSIQAYLDQICYRTNDTILISAVAENDTNRIMSSVYAKLFRRTRYRRKHETKTYHDVVAEYFGERVLPREFIRWENLEFKIPAVSPSITKSKRIRVDYFLRVGMYQLFRDEIHVDLPIVIGTTVEILEEQRSQQRQHVIASISADIRASLSPNKENSEVSDRQNLEEIADIFMQMPYTGKRPSVQYISALARKNQKQDSLDSTPRKNGSDDSEYLYGDERPQISKSADFLESGYYNDTGYLSPTSNLSSRRASETSIHVSSRPETMQNRLSSSQRISPQRQPSWTPTQSANATPRDADNSKEAYQRALRKAKSQSNIKQTGPASMAAEMGSAQPSPRKASPVKRPTMRKAASQGTIDMKAVAQVAAGLGNLKTRRSMKIKSKEDILSNGDVHGYNDNADIKVAESPKLTKVRKSDDASLKRSASYSSPVKSTASDISLETNTKTVSKSSASPVKKPTVKKAASQGRIDMKTAAQVATGLSNVKRVGSVKVKAKGNKSDSDTPKIPNSPEAIVSSNKESSQSPNTPRNNPEISDSVKVVDNNIVSISNVNEAAVGSSTSQTGKKEENATRIQRKSSSTRRSTSRAPDMSPIAGSQQSSPVKETMNAKANHEAVTKETSPKQGATVQSKSSTSTANRQVSPTKKANVDTKAKKQLVKAGNRLSAAKAFAGSTAKSKPSNSSLSRAASKPGNTSTKPAAKSTSDSRAKGVLRKSSKQMVSSSQINEGISKSIVPDDNKGQQTSQSLNDQNLGEINNNLPGSSTTIESKGGPTEVVVVDNLIGVESKSFEATASEDSVNNTNKRVIAFEDEIIPAAEEVNLERTPSLDHFEMLENDLHQSEVSSNATGGQRLSTDVTLTSIKGVDEDEIITVGQAANLERAPSLDHFEMLENELKQSEASSGAEIGRRSTTSRANKQVLGEEEVISVDQVTNLERAPSLDEFEKFEKEAMLANQHASGDINLGITVLKSANSAQIEDANKTRGESDADATKETVETRTERRISRVTVIDSAGNTVAKQEDIFEVRTGDDGKEIDKDAKASQNFLDGDGKITAFGVVENDSFVDDQSKVGAGELSSGYVENQGSISDGQNSHNDSYDYDTVAADISQENISSSRSSTHDLTRGFYTPPEFVNEDSTDTVQLTQVDVSSVSHPSVNAVAGGSSKEITENGVVAAFQSEVKDENANKASSKANVWKETIAKVRMNQKANQPGRRRSVVNIRVTNQEH